MSNSVVTLSSFNLLFFTQVLTVLTSTIKYNEYVTDKGENISIPCIADGNIMWVKENASNNSTIIQTGKYLVLTNVSASDNGVYVCFAAVTPSRRVHNVKSYSSNNSDNNGTSLSATDEVEKENLNKLNNNQGGEEDEEKEEEQVLLTTHTNTNQENDNDDDTNTLVKQPSVENNLKTTKNTQIASTTSMLPMPNVTATATTKTTTTPNLNSSTASSSSALASASATTSSLTTTTTSTTTTIIIKTLSDSNISTHSTSTTNSSQHHHKSSSNSSSSSSSSNSSSHSSSSSSSSNSHSDISLTTFTPLSPTTTIDDIEEQEFQAFQKINLTVRTPPGPVTKLYFKASTILGFLIWRFNKTNSGGYPVRSFTAEFRNISYETPPFNSSYEHEWSRMDPINIAPNVRQMEVYRLEPNTTYEFRIWANNHLGSGEVVTTNVTTLPETKEEDLIRLIQPDLDNFDPRIWIVAVSIVLGTFVILAIGLCIVLTKECYQSSRTEFEDGWDNIELIPNIILNPGFCETNGQPFLTRTVMFEGNEESDESYESESDHEPRMDKFKRKLSVFFTDPAIYRSHI